MSEPIRTAVPTMKYTDETIEFINGQVVSTHSVFVDTETGQKFIHEPGSRTICWHRLEDYGKNRVVHDPATFYANARRAGHTLSPQALAAEKAANVQAALRGQDRVASPTPMVLVDPASGKFVPNTQK